jgi:hypothetical protein
MKKRTRQRLLRRALKALLKNPLVFRWGLVLLQLAELIGRKT